MGVPIVSVKIRGPKYRIFFDTGATISYLNSSIPADFPHLGQIRDFFPTDGWFKADVYELDFRIGRNPYKVRCGRLPEKVETLRRAMETMGVAGLIGIDLFKERPIGYFPRRKLIVI